MLKTWILDTGCWILDSGCSILETWQQFRNSVFYWVRKNPYFARIFTDLIFVIGLEMGIWEGNKVKSRKEKSKKVKTPKNTWQKDLPLVIKVRFSWFGLLEGTESRSNWPIGQFDEVRIQETEARIRIFRQILLWQQAFCLVERKWYNFLSRKMLTLSGWVSN